MARKCLSVYMNKVKKWPYYKFILIQFAALVFIHIFFIALMKICVMVFSLESAIPVQNIHELCILKSILKLVIGAIIETFVFQTILYYAFCKKEKLLSPSKYIICSSILFALAHLTQFDGIFIIDLLQILCHFFAGIVYAFIYYIAKKERKNAFISVALIHFMFNLCVVGMIWIGVHK